MRSTCGRLGGRGLPGRGAGDILPRMMKPTFAAAVLALLPLAAHASDILGVSVRIGPSYPLDSDTRDFTNEVGYNAGLRWEWPLPALLGSASGIDVEGFMSRDGSDQVSYVGVGYFEQLRFLPAGPAQPYIGLGVGAYRVGVEAERTVGSETVDASDDGIRPGGRAMVGVDLIFGLMVEASGVIVGELDGANASSINLAVGFRF